MANEQKNKNAVATETTETETTVTETTESQAIDLKLFVERKPAKDKFGKLIRTKSGEPIYNYILPVQLRGRTSNVDFISIDKGGYEPLEFVYNGGTTAELLIIPYENEINGKKQSGLKYEVANIDEDGIRWKCGVRPARQSDKDILAMYINVLMKKIS